MVRGSEIFADLLEGIENSNSLTLPRCNVNYCYEAYMKSMKAYGEGLVQGIGSLGDVDELELLLNSLNVVYH
jgi:hypothetical protein